MTITPMPRIEIPAELVKQMVYDGVTDAFSDPQFRIIVAIIIAVFLVSAVIAGISGALGSRRR